MKRYNNSSFVEKLALKKSGRRFSYTPAEKIKIIEVPNFPSLGKLTALRFIEWLQLNPEGVMSLPTGKTPEHFIKWTQHFLANWNKKDVQKDLAENGITVKNKPKMHSYRFVQIDEFYPINPRHENSFVYYIHKYYVKGFGIDPRKSILVDCWKNGAPQGKNLEQLFPEGRVDISLRSRSPKSELEKLQYKAITAADQFTMEYEEKIREMGGIGFFLGGIGPDGHIGFNIKGSDHFSTTRVIPINYETAAAAATDLGGIEVSQNKVVMTIGLKTITQNPTSTVIITAAGASKAKVVKESIENKPSVLYPATALQGMDGARFYLTKGAAGLLVERRFDDLKNVKSVPLKQSEQILVDISAKQKKAIKNLSKQDLASDRLGNLLLKKNINLKNTLNKVSGDLTHRIEEGLKDIENKVFLHTAPHHDDIMLGYLPYVVHLVRTAKNAHYFATLTSGFTSVTNLYTQSRVKDLEEFLKEKELPALLKKGYFSRSNRRTKNFDIYQYLDGVAANSIEMQKEAEARRLLRNLIRLTGKTRIPGIKAEIKKLKDYFAHCYPGKKDTPAVQTLKGMIREWEEELLWGHLGFNCDYIYHLRLGFYTGDIFTPQPSMERDVQPILALLRETNPDVITVALDPEGSGPDTHYKVLQAIAEALRIYVKTHSRKNIRIWGYRNVWYRFHPSEADVFVPVSMNSLSIMKSAFHICFGSQRSASFPSYEYNGPFCDLAQKIMVEQYATIKSCLGRDYFYTNPIPRMRASRALNFIRSMSPDEFFQEAQSLKKLLED